MKFTGERFVPTEQGKIRLEHYHRYSTILDLVSNKDVLDVACGEGYGSEIIAKIARTVVGVDISEKTISHATSTYKRANLEFHQGNVTKLNFPDASFDVVVSFETIEHLFEQEKVLSEFKRVLKQDGSSPNRPIYSEESGEHNEFHAKELDFDEFDELLKSQFPTVEFYGQRMMMGSMIKPFLGESSTFHACHDDGINLYQGTGKALQDPVYFIALCAFSENKLPIINPSVLYPDNLDLIKHYVGFAKWAQNSEAEIKTLITERVSVIAERDALTIERDALLTERDALTIERDAIIAERASAITERDTLTVERDAIIAERASAITERDALTVERDAVTDERDSAMAERDALTVERDSVMTERDALTVERDAVTAQVSQIIKSRSWNLTHPLRVANRYYFKRFFQIIHFKTKSAYLSLPISYSTKASHKNFLAKYLPQLLSTNGVPAGNPVALQPPKTFTDKTSFDQLLQVINLKQAEDPKVSIIIPIYGKIDYTLRCLASISENSPTATYEVIVVDDCSPDDSTENLATIRNIHLICNNHNQGFIQSCNNGASVAKGKYLYFLNNDTETTPGWLDELLLTFISFPETGLAGSKLIYPDGKLQEAGGIVWQDGSAWNFGRLQDPMHPVYCYAREVDYCSGASIMIPKTLFDELGGFDTHYKPAYYEDTDLCMKVRSKGYRVIYQPLSIICHHEGITSGIDVTQGAKAHQVTNKDKFFKRWENKLKKHQKPANDVDTAKDRIAENRVLIIDHTTPTPDKDSGSIDIYNIMLLLREMDFQVTFIPEDNLAYIPHYTDDLQRRGIEVLYAPYITDIEAHLNELGPRYDLVFLFRVGVAEKYLDSVRKLCPLAKIIFQTVDLHFLRLSREAQLSKGIFKNKIALDTKELELNLIKKADISTVISDKELSLLEDILPEANVKLLPYTRYISGTSTPVHQRKDIVFVGGFQHRPNIDAVNYFVDDIMPKLRIRLPEVKFHIVGSNPPIEIQSLSCEDINVLGFVENLTPLLDKMRISVAPLRYGAGIKGKIGTAMAIGLPVVGTSLAVEGMCLTDGENILVADSAEEISNAIANLYKNETLWNQISQNSLEFSKATWGEDVGWENLAVILRTLNFNPSRKSRSLSLYQSI